MKKISFLALALVLAICLPMLASCTIKKPFETTEETTTLEEMTTQTEEQTAETTETTETETTETTEAETTETETTETTEVEEETFAESIALNKNEVSLIKGCSETLIATITPENTTNKTLTWITSNPSVATVVDGIVTAISSGTAIITVTTSNGLTATCVVTVTVQALGVTLDRDFIQINEDENTVLTATVMPSDTTNKTLMWTTSDSSVVTVNNGVIKAVSAGTATITVTTATGLTDTCQVTVIKNGIIFKTLKLVGTDVYGKVSNTTTSFSFLNEVVTSGNATYELYRDMECEYIIRSKTASLVVGDNTFYILEYQSGEVSALYEVTIRRRPMYIVTFDSNGGTAAESQTIEEDSFVTVPQTSREGYAFAGWDRDLTLSITNDTTISALWTNNTYTVTYDANGGDPVENSTVVYDCDFVLNVPRRTGYTFVGWYYGDDKIDLESTWTITDNVNLRAEWMANTNTSYKVEHYIEMLDGSYELIDTDDLTGMSDSEITPATKTYVGFTDPETQTVTVLPDGSLVVRYEYTRNSYTVYFDVKGGMPVGQRAFVYGSEYELPKATKTGYVFEGWYYGEDKIDLEGIWTIAEEITLRAEWAPSTNTVYTVEHYIEKLGGGYELIDTETLFGTTDSSVTPATKTYSGFTSPATQTVTVLPSGSRVVIYEYKRNSYTVMYITNGGDNLTSPEMKYESTLPEAIREGYTFGGWFSDVDLSVEVTSVPATDVTLYAYWKEENKPSDFTYSGTDSITINSYTASDKTVCIPTYIGGIAVKIIDSVAFYLKTIESVTIPAYVTFIGHNAFSYTNITSIEIPASVVSIDRTALNSCKNLISITVAADNAVYHSTDNCIIETASKTLIVGCKSSIIPADGSVTSIGDSAFWFCASLTSITIPDSIASISDTAFTGCTNIESAAMPTYMISYIPQDSLKTVVITSGITIPNQAFFCSDIESIELPSSITGIGDFAFAACTKLTSITFGENSRLQSIGSNAFQNCTSLEAIDIPDSVTNIGENAFRDCSSLKTITFEKNSKPQSIGNNAFQGCTSLTMVNYTGSEEQWASITIGSNNSPLINATINYNYVSDEK